MATTTYSFADVALVISHPAVGRYVAHGAGLGSIDVTMTTERTKQDVAADGSVMVTKVEGNNGTIALAIQQTSAFNKWLLNAYNFLNTASVSDWAGAAVTIRSPTMQYLISATGVSFQVLPPVPLGADGVQITWTLMAASITQVSV